MTQKLLLFLLVFFTSLTGKSQLADSCNNYTFQRLYTLPTGTPGKINDVIENADGTLVAVGEVSGSALIMKTNRKGDVIWAKKIAGSAGDKFQHIKKTLDGGYLAIGITNSFGGYYLVKFTSTGGLTWAHSFPEPTLNNISDAIQTSDGGYAIILQSGVSPIGLLAVMRLDNNANTLWTKEYKVNGFFVTTSWPGGILEENDSLVISGSVEDTLTGVFPTVEYHTLSKLSKVDGSVYWAKRWLGGQFFTGLCKYNNFYYVPNILNGQQLITKLDINGNITSVIHLQDVNSAQMGLTVQTHDNALLITRAGNPSNLLKIGSNDSIVWANQYPVTGATASSFNCIRESSNNQIIAGGSITSSTSGILLSKLTANGTIGVCPVTPFTTVKTNPTLVSHPFTWTWIHSDPISNNYVGPTSTDVTFTITNICSNITDCDTLKLSGTSTACMNTDTITFTTHRSATCFSTVQFQVDPLYGSIISSTDSTAKVVFSAAGNAKVIASISNPCGLLKDSLTVTVTNCTPGADSCTHYSFQKLYALQGSSQNNIADCVENPDGTVVFAGYKDNTTPFTTQHIAALIMKVKRNGDVVWAKEIGGNWRDKFQHIKQTSDGGYIAAGVSDSYLGSIVVKFDASGNILWSRAIGEIQGESVDILPLSDGSYAISMEGGSLSPYIEIVKLDGNGNTLWYKYYSTLVNLSSTSSLSGGMIEENDSLVFTGLCKDSSGPQLYFQTLTKINKYNGNVYWAKRWSGGTELTRLVKVNNYYYISHRINAQTVTTKLDLNGNIVKCSYFSDTLNSFYNIAINSIGVTHNNDLIVSRVNNQLNLTRVSANGFVQWANQYPIAGPAPSAFTCIKESSNNDIIAAGNTGIYNGGNTIIITRATPDGTTSICQKTPFASSEIIIPLTSQSFTWNTFPGFFFFNTIVTPPVANVNYILTTQCSTIVGGCDSLKLTGIDSACSSTDTITYTAHRSASCFSSVQFSVDPARGTVINFTDTTARIVFAQAGPTKIIASISNPCGVLKDSLTVSVTSCNPPIDSCINYTYQNLYSPVTGEPGKILDVIETSDGNTAAVGQVGSRAFIMKVNPAGQVKWAKSIGGTQDDKFRNFKQTSDGGYIALGTTNSFGQAYYTMFLVKMDSAGTVSWARSVGKLRDTYPSDNRVCTVLQTSDGGYAILGYTNSLNESMVILRTDANGNTVWHRYFNMLNSIDFCTAGGLVEENDSLVFTTESPNLLLPQNGYESITKLNKSNGNVIWAKRWTDGTYYSDLHKVNNYYYVSHSFANHLVITKLDINGNILRTFSLSDNITGTYPSLTYPTHDGGILISRFNTPPNITRIGSSDQVQWANQYPQLPGELFSIKETSNDQIIGGGFSNSQIPVMFLTRKNPNGSGGTCPVTSFSTAEATYNLTSQSFSWTNIQQDNPFNNVLVTPTTTDVVLNVNNLCTSSTTCDSLKLTGVDSACMSTDTITYTARRGAACFSSVQFTVDPARGIIINSTDTSARVVFIQPGIVKVFASITNPCGLLRDSLQVQIFGSPAPVNLGPDLTLCQNARDTLHAGPGFRTYHWQDGSTDSVLIVTISGQYFVTATNYCGAMFRDTVNVNFAAPQALHIGNDTSKCNADTLTLTATGGFASYTWSPNYTISSTGSQTVKVWPAIDTSYKLSATTALGCTSKDSIRISVFHSTPVNLGNDTSFCKGGSVVLNAGPGFINYLWNTGATTQLLIADSARQYIITAINVHQCISRDTLNILAIYPNPVVNLRKDSSLCSGSSITLDAGPGYTNYLWQDGSTARTLSISNIGTYSVTVTDVHQCKGSDTSSLKLILPLPANFIYPDTAICEVQTITLLPSSSFASYLWSTGSTANRINITSAGSYWLQVTNTEGCTAKEYITVAPKNCIKAVYFPNAFTPNMDGLNDVFHATVYGSLIGFHLVIYNRFGQKVFETTDQSKGWDGKLKGQDVGIGTFVWFCSYQFVNATAQTQKGSVTLLR